jgi:A/G-specific adenine glycosylase
MCRNNAHTQTPIDGHLHKALDYLCDIGQERGPFLPWHTVDQPYNWLVAESLLRRTTRTAAQKAYSSLVREYPDWESLSTASQDEIAAHISWVGLGKQRARQLKAMAIKVVSDLGADMLGDRQKLESLPGVGPYIAEAVLLYVYRQRHFPIDANIQRVLRRIAGLPTPIGTRHSNPYRDPYVQRACQYIISRFTNNELISLHRGLLIVAWENCRPRPQCNNCPLSKLCGYKSGHPAPRL